MVLLTRIELVITPYQSVSIPLTYRRVGSSARTRTEKHDILSIAGIPIPFTEPLYFTIRLSYAHTVVTNRIGYY